MVIMLIFIIILFLNWLDKVIESTLHVLCDAKVESIGITVSNKAIDEVMGDLVTFVKGEEGKLIALKSNIVKMNQIASEIAVKIQEMYDSLDRIYVYVPLGNFTGNDLLSGMGPNIKIRVMPAGTVMTEFKTEFLSAGINQTRHRVYINVVCHMRVIAPFASDDVLVDNSVTVAETILIGDVPEYYHGKE